MSRHFIVRSLLVVGVASLAGVFAVKGVVDYQLHKITHPTRSPHTTALQTTGQFQNVTLTTADGLQLQGWYQPPQNNVTIILQHGYSGNSEQMLPAAKMLAKHGYGALLFDFRGHGDSEGDLVTIGLYEAQDTDAAVRFLTQQPETQHIGLIGNSMGGAVGVLAAANNTGIEAVAIEGVFAQLQDEVGVGIEVKTPLPAWPFDSIFISLAELNSGYKIGSVAPIEQIGLISPRPILIMQGGKDERVYADTGEKLFAAAGEPKEYWFEPGVAHVSFAATLPTDYERRIIEFFDKHLLNNH
jgi:uncharacterized protein